jgi:hypothetical protein
MVVWIKVGVSGRTAIAEEAYYREEESKPGRVAKLSNPDMKVAYFIHAMSRMITFFYLREEALTAVMTLGVLPPQRERMVIKCMVKAWITGKQGRARPREASMKEAKGWGGPPIRGPDPMQAGRGKGDGPVSAKMAKDRD